MSTPIWGMSSRWLGQIIAATHHKIQTLPITNCTSRHKDGLFTLFTVRQGACDNEDLVVRLIENIVRDDYVGVIGPYCSNACQIAQPILRTFNTTMVYLSSKMKRSLLHAPSLVFLSLYFEQ